MIIQRQDNNYLLKIAIQTKLVIRDMIKKMKKEKQKNKIHKLIGDKQNPKF